MPFAKCFLFSLLVLAACLPAGNFFNLIDPDLVEFALEFATKKATAEMYKDDAIPAEAVSSFSKPNEQSLDTGFHGLVNSFALEWLRDRMSNTTTSDVDKCLPPQGFCKQDTEICQLVEPQAPVTCHKTEIYRQEDGSCHDLQQPNYGMAGTTFQRLVPNRYSDGCDLPRQYSLVPSSKCVDLPNSRTISTSLSQSVRTADKHVSLLFTTFGQFVDHDLTFTPVYHEKHGAKSSQPVCCPTKTSSQCEPIKVSISDKFYSKYHVTCLEFVRSLATTIDKSCGLGLRVQFNQNSHWLDGSNIYGSGKSSPNLRVTGGGQLLYSLPNDFQQSKISADPRRDGDHSKAFLPLSDPELCMDNQSVTVSAPCTDYQCCVYAGDLRAGEQPPLASMHTMWLRHHNTIAQTISDFRDDLDDEQVYQLSRKIVLAQYQFIVFNELLPEIIGTKRMKLEELQLLNGSQYLPASKYVSGQGKIFMEFSTAAGRFGHSLLDDYIFKDSMKSGSADSSFRLSDHLNRIDIALTSSDDVGAILKASCQHSALEMDQQVTAEVQNKLFKNSKPFGGDLLAINIERGRDHGIGTYYDVRKYCLGEVSVDPSWTSPVWGNNVFQKGALASLMKLYKSPMDVDLFAGGISELPEASNQGVVGPTFACVIAKQFQQLKFGDRFWFEFKGTMANGKSQFSAAELLQIRKTSLSRLLCDETSIISVARNALQFSTSTVKCDDPKFVKETSVDYSVFLPLE